MTTKITIINMSLLHWGVNARAEARFSLSLLAWTTFAYVVQRRDESKKRLDISIEIEHYVSDRQRGQHTRCCLTLAR